ncbi:N-acetylmuramoyl-L-alanine amidase [Succiniclasticum ruminis]|uniref:N-acetylmuramoyl-L-alanine amidase n=1 Tax=Succiniclasticum ruminis TaxID=40841 RepID=A0A1G6LCZ8_9FIRM|nr:N-acetylmuramoyl-L-alanine amidase [Succiniclasticum ruminis]SDC41081.1 N-acetylmuramoyl-L-alanine amidase [Succiniclasticum ruminis]
MRRKFLAFLVWAVCLLVTCTASAAALVTDVNWGVDKYNVLRMVVDLSENTQYNIKIANDRELQIKVTGGLGPKVVRRGSIKSDLAKSFSVDREQNGVVVRVPMTKKVERSDVKSFILKKDASTGRPPRLVVDVSTNKVNNASMKYGATSVRRPAIRPSQGPSTPVGNRVNFATTGGLKGKRITIDPGHGGSDPGAIGPKGNKEKTSTLLIANYLKNYLTSAGALVSMTRTTDKDVYGRFASARNELQARVDVSTRNRADAFVSIHHNANNNRNIGGIATYYYPKSGYDYKLGSAIQKKMAAASKLRNMGTQQANFYVIKRSYIPAVLLEVGFLSNYREEQLISSAWFQKTIAKAVFDGLKEYFGG